MYELNEIREVEQKGIQIDSDIAMAVFWYYGTIFSVDFMDAEPSMTLERKATKADAVLAGYDKEIPANTTGADDTAILKFQEQAEIAR